MPSASPDTTSVDVLIVGAGISGIGAAYYLQRDHPRRSYAILEARGASGGTWDLFRYPGIRSDSDLHTFGYEFRPWRDERSRSPTPTSILAYLRETAAEHGIDRHDPLPHQGGRRVLVVGATARWTVEVENTEHRRAVTIADLQLAVLRGRLLPLRRGLHAALRGARAVHRAGRPPAAVARRPRLRGQAGRRHRQRARPRSR